MIDKEAKKLLDEIDKEIEEEFKNMNAKELLDDLRKLVLDLHTVCEETTLPIILILSALELVKLQLFFRVSTLSQLQILKSFVEENKKKEVI